MPVIKTDGTENLRGDPHTHTSEPNASPSPKGTPAGGTENKRADPQVKTGATKDTTVYAKDDRPSGVQHFGEES